MNTSINDITEEQVARWMQAKAAEVAATLSVDRAAVSIMAHAGLYNHFTWTAHGDEACVSNDTLENAMRSLAQRITSPEQRALKLREEAAQLLSKAASITAAAVASARK